jgi:predicted nucleic acid-binding protein
MYEFFRVITHPRIFHKPWTAASAWKFVEAVLAAPSFGLLVPSTKHAEIAAEVLGRSKNLCGNILYDAQTAVLMREHGIKTIYTRDMDFHRFPFLDPVDPTL